MTIISGLANAEFIGDEPPSNEEMVSLTWLYLARLVK
jgi:hypothetical protein